MITHLKSKSYTDIGMRRSIPNSIGTRTVTTLVNWINQSVLYIGRFHKSGASYFCTFYINLNIKQNSNLKKSIMKTIINPYRKEEKFYPQANEWMWDYCIFLGKFTDEEGVNWDLGIHIPPLRQSHTPRPSGAIVFGNNPGDYSSPVLSPDFGIEGIVTEDYVKETIKRGVDLGYLLYDPKKYGNECVVNPELK